MTTLAGVLARTARRCPDRIAVQFGDVALTYAELDREVDALAAELAGRGLAQGDRMLLLAGNSDAFVVAVYAGLRLGAIVVPINPRSAPTEIDYLATDTGARLLLFGPEVADGVRAWHSLPDRTGEAEPLALGAVEGYDDVRSAARDHAARKHAARGHAARPAHVEVSEDDDALIIYTSGTTGRPKGALFDHRRVLWVGINTSIGMGLRDGERMLHVAPLYHAASLNMLLLNGMMLGATHVILPAFEPATVADTLARERITFFFGVPTMYTHLLRLPDLADRDLSRLRICLYGAAPMPAHTAEALVAALPDAWIVQACGQTEGGPGGILLHHDDVVARPEASGRVAVPNTEVRIVDPSGNDVEPGGVGEMIMRGESMMKGYWRKPEATAETVRDGWVHTGDLARIDEDGYITLVDRLKDLIITGGANVYSAEVEGVLAAHPAVGDLAVVGRRNEEYGEIVVAVVDLAPGASLTLDELREYGRTQLSGYKLPRELTIGAVPRNPSGKILKHRLRVDLDG
ncbi:fatty-acyl-CoA synthase/feruloyl-CoA synthase [Pseudonocardia ammonioxydans]|uniref:Fatty-acyl-CoA synthase/feruloyl-CoA synthase n=1 Tax=Pseudonocardia ammonioxydans TaxID=260086 RepID=A0A1I4WZR8_PSUAM|nr:AMP-binding protein [Pseudonocardia ammonioxydans]SFN18489.1 fatty-acyl-CoA synthase/feruloyl-CoA synthase [Pseudonocardia ammonioxydans]